MDDFDKFERRLNVIGTIMIVLMMVIWLAVAFVAYHFIAKWW